MDYRILAAVFAAVIIATAVYHIFSKNKRLKLRLSESIGKTPEDTEHEFTSIKRYFINKGSSANIRTVDQITWNDLDMDKVFSRINVCLTSVGEEYLYACLHELEFSEVRHSEREAFFAYLKEHPSDLLKMQLNLYGMGKSNYNGLSSFILNAEYKSLKYPHLYTVLAFVPLACIALIIPNPSLGIFCLVISFILNIAAHYISSRKITTELSAIRYFSAMLICCHKIAALDKEKKQPLLTRLKNKFSVFSKLTSKTSGIMLPPVTDVELIFEYIKILFLMDIRNYNKTIATITKHAEDCHDLFKIIGEIDMSISIYSFRKSLPFYTTPVFLTENSIEFNEVYHPLLSSPVANSGAILNDSIITGSNASGKTTFIKALAVNGILAQTIHTCTAKNFAMRFSLIITSMALRDSILDGDSYFIVEIKSLKRILDKLGIINCTCFIDEILRGTNTAERVAASASVLKYMHGKDCLCLVASHDIELTQILESTFDNYNFCEQITDDGLVFDYKLKNGASKTRNAIKLLGYMGFEKSIVEDAEEMARKF